MFVSKQLFLVFNVFMRRTVTSSFYFNQQRSFESLNFTPRPEEVLSSPLCSGSAADSQPFGYYTNMVQQIDYKHSTPPMKPGILCQIFLQFI